MALAVSLIAQLVSSEPARKKILDELDIQTGEDTASIRISLTSPVRYIRHFPYVSGKELRINIRLFDVGSDNREGLFRRETLVPSGNEDLPLNEVVYEGDIEGGPYLTLFFSQCVDFEVQQGTDSRSIEVLIRKNTAEAPPHASPEPDEE